MSGEQSSQERKVPYRGVLESLPDAKADKHSKGEAVGARSRSTYGAIVDEQTNAEDWQFRDDVIKLKGWGETLIRKLEIRVKDAELLHLPLIRMEPNNIKNVGSYRAKRDGYAIAGTIVLNPEALASLPAPVVLIVLLKFLLAAREHRMECDGSAVPEDESKPRGIFDRKGCGTLEAFGVIIRRNRRIVVSDDGPFASLLKDHGIDCSREEFEAKPAREGRTTNGLWSCNCQKVRVGKRVFFARCSHCRTDFRPGDNLLPGWADAR